MFVLQYPISPFPAAAAVAVVVGVVVAEEASRHGGVAGSPRCRTGRAGTTRNYQGLEDGRRHVRSKGFPTAVDRGGARKQVKVL